MDITSRKQCAVESEGEPGWFYRSLHPEGLAGRGQGGELAPRAIRRFHPDDAHVLAERDQSPHHRRPMKDPVGEEGGVDKGTSPPSEADIGVTKGETTMKPLRLTQIIIVAAALLCGASLSFDRSQEMGVSLSIDSAQARVGRPLTPVSGAGVARRTTRRAVGVAPVVAAPVVRRPVVVVPR